MDHFEYRGGTLFAEDVSVASIIESVGSPAYIYSRATLERHFRAFEDSLAEVPHQVCYAVKANSNLAVLNVLARLGAWFDIVSEGELRRVLAAGGKADTAVFSGVGKKESEIRYALQQGIHCLNIESFSELNRVVKVASELGVRAPIALRVNPNVDARTHPYISTGLKENKFGIETDVALSLYRQFADNPALNFQGIACHIGSQLTTLAPFLDALDRVLELADQLAQDGIHLPHIDMGGGLGVPYRDEQPPSPSEYAAAMHDKLAGRNLEIHIEPGRAIAANAGILVTRVEYLKSNEHKGFAIVDAAMNDMMRPALYQAWQNIIPVNEKSNSPRVKYDVVGPVCETGDFLGKDRELALAEGDLLAVRSAGAYGFVMSSNYNSRPRVAEVMVDGSQFHVVREREKYSDLWSLEKMLQD